MSMWNAIFGFALGGAVAFMTGNPVMTAIACVSAAVAVIRIAHGLLTL